MVDMGKKLHQNPNLDIRELDGELFILDERLKCIHHLNVTASAIWRFLEKPAKSKEVLAVFREIYPDADQTALKASLRKSMRWMRANDILHLRTV